MGLARSWLKTLQALCGVMCVGLALAAPLTPTEKAAANAQLQETLRQQARQRALRESQEQRPDVRLEMAAAPEGPAAIPEGETPCLPISQIELDGEGSSKFLFALAHAYKPGDAAADEQGSRCLGSVGINLVMKRLQNAIIERGFVTTRVLAEVQDLRTGTLRLTVVPGRVRSVRFAEGTSTRATQWNAVPVRTGQLLNLRDIEQALENFKRVPTAEADIQIAPSTDPDAQPGESDLVVVWGQARPVRLSTSVDDAGSRSTGKYQANVTVSVDHGLRLNDLFYINANHDLGGGDPGARGSKGASVHYSVPYGYWQLGFTNTRSDYFQTVKGEGLVNSIDPLYRGDSFSNELKLSRLVYRDSKRKSTVSLSGWTRKSHNFIGDAEVLVQRRRTAGWELEVGHREFVGAAIVDASLSYRRGTGAQKAMSSPEEASGEGTSRMQFLTADVQYRSPFTLAGQDLTYAGTLRGQRDLTPLPSTDRYSIGGRSTVRGFDGEAALSAERGWLIRNDLGLRLGQTGMEAYLGLDYGRVGGPAAQALAGKQLAGAVLGLRGGYKQLGYDVFVGAPVSKPDRLGARTGVTGFSLSGSF